MRWESSSSYAPRTAQRGFAPHHAVSRGVTRSHREKSPRTARPFSAQRVDGGAAAYSLAIPLDGGLQKEFRRNSFPRGVPRGHPLTTRKARHKRVGLFLWWERVDSDHRRHCQQIYSLSPLATRERSHMKLNVFGGEAAAEHHWSW